MKLPLMAEVFRIALNEEKKQVNSLPPDILKSWINGRREVGGSENPKEWKIYKNQNGSYEMWPETAQGETSVEVYNPKTKQWMNSDYVDDHELDAATGIKNWRGSGE